MTEDQVEYDEGGKGKKDAVFSTKASKDVMERAYKLKDQSGLSLKDWFEAAVAEMEVKSLQGSEAEQSQDTQQVSYHVNRVMELFMGQVQKLLDLKVDFNQKLSEENLRHKGIVDTLQEQKQKIAFDKELIEQEIEDLRKRNIELESQSNESQDELKTNARTIAIIQARNDELEEKVAKLPKFEEEMNALKESFIDERKVTNDQINKLKEQIESDQKEVDRLQHVLELSEERRVRAEEEGERKVQNMEQVAVLKLEKTIAESDRKISEQHQKLTEEWAKIEHELNQKNETLVQKNHDLEIKEGNLVHKNEELNRQVKELQEKIAGLEKQIEKQALGKLEK